MFKSLLVSATGNDTDAVAYATAHAVARGFGAHIDALHVRLDPAGIATTMSTEGAGGTLLQGTVDSLEKDADEGEAKARSIFTAFCAREKVARASAAGNSTTTTTAGFHVEIGEEPRWTAAYALTCDLAVATRGTPGDNAAARSTLEALLFETGRPLLIPGPSAPAPDFADRIAIAWKPGPQAARAVAAAMPLLARAKEITVLTIAEDESARDETARLIDYLGWHGLRVVAERIDPGADGPAALLTAASAKSGLLVMGGYSHTRVREWVFGGFTQSVLDHAELPVLMAH
jgi:nucleotide-binding universal stress UspA family protein